MDEMDELLGEFLVESTENLDRLDREFVELESDPASREILASIFRTVHTIKGTAGFLGFDRLGEVSHAGESLLSRLRDGEMALDAEMTSALLAMVDAIRGMLSQVETTGSDEGGDHSQLVARLESFLEGGTPEANDTKTYDNGVKVVPSFLLPVETVYRDTIKTALVDTGYYTAQEVASGKAD